MIFLTWQTLLLQNPCIFIKWLVYSIKFTHKIINREWFMTNIVYIAVMFLWPSLCPPSKLFHQSMKAKQNPESVKVERCSGSRAFSADFVACTCSDLGGSYGF